MDGAIMTKAAALAAALAFAVQALGWMPAAALFLLTVVAATFDMPVKRAASVPGKRASTPSGRFAQLEDELNARVRELPTPSLRGAFGMLARSPEFRRNFHFVAAEPDSGCCPFVLRGAAIEAAYSITVADLTAARLRTSPAGVFFSKCALPDPPVTSPATREQRRPAELRAVEVFHPLPANTELTRSRLGAQLAADGVSLSVSGVGAVFPAAARICRLAGEAFRLAVNANLYLTARGNTVGTPAHSDCEDNLILQLAGHKEWTLVAPEPQHALPSASCTHVLGKGSTPVPATYAPLFRAAAAARARGEEDGWVGDGGRVRIVSLRPGDVLFVPRGWLHCTATVRSRAERRLPRRPAAAPQPPAGAAGACPPAAHRAGGCAPSAFSLQAGAGEDVLAGCSISLTLSLLTDTVHGTAHKALVVLSALRTAEPPTLRGGHAEGWVGEFAPGRGGVLDDACRAMPALRAPLPLGFASDEPAQDERSAAELLRLLDASIGPHLRTAAVAAAAAGGSVSSAGACREAGDVSGAAASGGAAGASAPPGDGAPSARAAFGLGLKEAALVVQHFKRRTREVVRSLDAIYASVAGANVVSDKVAGAGAAIGLGGASEGGASGAAGAGAGPAAPVPQLTGRPGEDAQRAVNAHAVKLASASVIAALVRTARGGAAGGSVASAPVAAPAPPAPPRPLPVLAPPMKPPPSSGGDLSLHAAARARGEPLP